MNRTRLIRIKQIVYLSLLLFISCKNNASDDTSDTPKTNVGIANEFVDAFYSFNRDSLAAVLSNAKESHPEILYYQKWAECGNYKVIKRDRVIEKNDTLVLCSVTVKDDLMGSLQIDFNVTDTFHVIIQEGQIRSVTTSSNDPDEYYAAKEWVKKNRPEYIEKPCAGIWAGGPTPCECIQGMIRGFTELKATENN